MASFSQLTKSKEFQDLDSAGKIKAVEEHWDAVELAATSDEMKAEAARARELTLGGIDAWSRAANINGDQSEADRASAEMEAKAFDAAWSLFGSGKTSSDPEASARFNQILGGIDNIRNERRDQLNREAGEAVEVSRVRNEQVGKLYEFLDRNHLLKDSIQAVNSSSGVPGLIYKPDGTWETPVINQEDPANPRGMLDNIGMAISQNIGERSNKDGFLGFGRADSAMPEMLQQFGQETGMSPEEIQTAWSDFSNHERRWQEGEKIRVLSHGGIKINPAGAATLDEQGLRNEIMKSTASDIQKRYAIQQIPQARAQAAAELSAPLAAWSTGRPWRENFIDTWERELKEGRSQADITRDYIARNKIEGIGGGINTIIDKLGAEGSLKVAGTIAGAAAAVTGVDALTEGAAKINEASNIYSRGESSLAGPRGMAGKIWAGALAEAPSLAVMVMLTRGVGAGTALASRAGLEAAAAGGPITAAEAAASTAARVRAAAFITSTGTAGVQSMGLTYSDLVNKKMQEGYTADEAHEYAAPKAYAAGLATAMITGAFGAAGLGGTEGAINNMTVSQFAAKAAASGVTTEAAAKSMFSKMLSKGASLTSGRVGAFTKGGIGEYGEEALDQFVGAFIQADPNTPITDAFEQAHEAGMIGLGIGGASHAITHKAAATDPKNRTKAEREALRRASQLADVPSVHELWINDAGERVGLNIEESGLMTRTTEQADGSWEPDTDEKSRPSLHRELAAAGFRQASGIQFDEEGHPSHSVLIDEEQGKKQSQAIIDERDKTLATWAARFGVREQERRDATSVRRAAQIEQIKNTPPEEKRKAALDLIDNLAAIQQMRANAPDTAEADAEGRPEPERRAGLFDYNAVAGADDTFTAAEDAPQEIKDAVGTLARNGVTSKNQLMTMLNGAFIKGAPAVATEIIDAARFLFAETELGNFSVLPEGVTRGANGELVSTSEPEIPTGARTPAQRAAHAAAAQTITDRIAVLEKQIAEATEPKGKSKKAEAARAKTEAARAELKTQQEALDTLRRARTNELRAARGLEPLAAQEEATAEVVAAEEAATPAETPAPAAETPAPEESAKKKEKREKAKKAATVATEATAEAEAPAATAPQAEQAATRAEEQAAAAPEGPLKEQAEQEAKEAKKAALKAKADAMLAEAEAKRATAAAVKAAAEVQPEKPKPLKAKKAADFATTGTWVVETESGPVNIFYDRSLKHWFLDERRTNGSFPDLGETKEEALKKLASRIARKKAEQSIPQADQQVTTNEETTTPPAAEPAASVTPAQETGNANAPVEGAQPEGSPTAAATPAGPSSGSETRLTPKAAKMAGIIKGQLERGIKDGTLSRINPKKGEINNALMEDMIGELVESGVLTFAQIAPLANLSPEALPEAVLAMVNEALGIKPDETPAIQKPRKKPTVEDTNTRKVIAENAKPGVNDSEKAKRVNKAVQNKEAEPKPETKRKAAKKVAETKTDEAVAEVVANEVAEAEDPNDPATNIDMEPEDELEALPPDADQFDGSGLPPDYYQRLHHRTPVERVGGSAASPTLPAKALHKLIAQLQRRFGIRISWAKLPDGIAGRFVEGSNRVQLNQNIKVGADTPLHEIGHAFLAAVRAKNEALYNSLLEELDAHIDSDPELQRVRNRVIDKYGEENEQLLMEETMVAYLSQNAEAIHTKQYWKDRSDWESKTLANKAWSLIRDMLSSIFRGNRQSVANIDAGSTLNDIAALLVSPDARFDLTKGSPRGSASPRTLLLEHAIGIKAAAQTVLDSLHDTSKGFLAFTRDAKGRPQISITISDSWAALTETVGGMIEPIKKALGSDARHAELFDRWTNHPDHNLDEDFWKGFEQVRAVVSNLTGQQNPTHRHLGYILEVISPSFAAQVQSATPDFRTMQSMLQLRDELLTTPPSFVAATVARVPGSAIPPLAAAFSRLGELQASLDPDQEGQLVPLSEEDITTIQDMMRERIAVANYMVEMAAHPDLTEDQADAALEVMFTNEHAAAVGISRATGINPLAKEGLTVEDYVARRIDPRLGAWATRQMGGKIGEKRTPKAEASETEKAVAASVESTLSAEEKATAAEEMGFKRWGSRARAEFQKQFADWIVAAKAKTEKLAGLFRKVAAGINAALASALVAISLIDVPPSQIEQIPVTEIKAEAAETPAPRNPEPSRPLIKDAPPSRPAPEPVNEAPKPQAKAPDFKGEKVSGDTAALARWVVNKGDNNGKPFVIADKGNARITFFDAEGNLVSESAAIYGSTPGDVDPKLPIDQARGNPKARVTPGGRFEGRFDQDRKYGPTVIFAESGENSVLAIHRVVQGREGFMASKTKEDNRQSVGCINVPNEVADDVLPTLKDGAVVYVTPETPEGIDLFEGFEEALGKDVAVNYARQRSPKPAGPSTAPVTPPKRFGDGTKDGLFNAIPSNKAFSFDGGTKIMPKADGTPSGPFNELRHAQSFRSVAAAKEGLKETELKIWKIEEGGRITYAVVVPGVLGRGEQQRIGQMGNPAALSAAMSQALVLKQLPTMAEMKELMVKNPLAMRKMFRQIQAFIKEKLPEDADTQDDLDFMKQLDELDSVVLLNKYQNYVARLQATVATNTLRARHKGAFQINTTDVNGPDHGKVTNVQLKPGQSPYLSDILQKSMVDPHAYALTPAQTAMVDDMRVVLENMRGLMIDAKLDKKFLDQHGLDTGDFLSKPVKGKDTWREYFPRMVQGWVTPGGRFERKQFLGSGSTKTEIKGSDKARIVDPVTGKPKTMQQVKEDPETKHIIYAADPFDTINHFLTNSYSAIAASDLAQNLTPFAKDGQKATLKETFIPEIRVVNDLFDQKIAEYLTERLVKDQAPSGRVERIVVGVKALKLGAFDIAAPFTTALAFTVGHPVSEFLRGRWFGGVGDVARVFGTGIKENVIPAFMKVITGTAQDSVNSIDGFDKMWKGNEQVFSELAALDGMLGSVTDYDEQVKIINQNAELSKSASGRAGLRGRVAMWMGGLGDFHRNYATFGKMMMWKGLRTRYVDEATGDLRTDQDSVKRMMQDVRGLDRAMGYSADLQLSDISVNMQGWSRILLTAPSMYLSMGLALTNPSGLKQVAPMVIGGLMFFFLSGKAADMEDEELYRRLDPRHKDFLKLDLKLPGGRMAQLSMSSFYKSIATLVGKEADVATKLANGEVVGAQDFWAPVAMFGSGRTSPFLQSVQSFITGKDFMDREISKATVIASALTPASVDEPLRVWVNRLLGFEGTNHNIASAEEMHTVTERQSMGDTATMIAGQILGLNIYGESESHAINRDRNVLSQQRLGVDFDAIPREKFSEGMQIIDDVAKMRGSPERFGKYDYVKAKKAATEAFAMRELPPEIRRMVSQAGLINEELEVPGLVKTPGKQNAYLTGKMKADVWKAAANDMITREKGLRYILDVRVRQEGCSPFAVRDEIKKVWNDSTKADNKRVQSAAGVRY